MGMFMIEREVCLGEVGPANLGPNLLDRRSMTLCLSRRILAPAVFRVRLHRGAQLRKSQPAFVLRFTDSCRNTDRSRGRASSRPTSIAQSAYDAVLVNLDDACIRPLNEDCGAHFRDALKRLQDALVVADRSALD